MSENMEIPKGWEITTLGEVAEYLNGRAFKPIEWEKTGIPIIRIQNLNDSGSSYNYTNQEFEDRYKVVKGDLLFAWSASLGVYIWKGNKAWLNQHIFKVISKTCCDKKFLFYTLNKITNILYAKAHGSGMVHVTKGKFEATQIYLPPLLEQHRIVDKIEALFSRLDKGIESLKTAQQQLKVYRQAVLKWAFEGKFTNENVKEGELPNGWKWVKLGNIVEKIQIGPFGSQLHKEDYIVGGIPLINPTHINNGLIVPNTSFSISEIKRDSLPNYILQEGDVIMGRRGEMGRCGLVSKKEAGWFCGTGSLYIRPKDKIANSFFLYYSLKGDTVKKYLEENAAGTTMANLNSTIVNNIPILFPSFSEQNLIVSAIESRLSVCDKVEKIITYSLKQAEGLRQSILKKAFEGKLVPQDPDDEPASVLLERIKAKNETNKPAKNVKTKKVK